MSKRRNGRLDLSKRRQETDPRGTQQKRCRPRRRCSAGNQCRRRPSMAPGPAARADCGSPRKVPSRPIGPMCCWLRRTTARPAKLAIQRARCASPLEDQQSVFVLNLTSRNGKSMTACRAPHTLSPRGSDVKVYRTIPARNFMFGAGPPTIIGRLPRRDSQRAQSPYVATIPCCRRMPHDPQTRIGVIRKCQRLAFDTLTLREPSRRSKAENR